MKTRARVIITALLALTIFVSERSDAQISSFITQRHFASQSISPNEVAGRALNTRGGEWYGGAPGFQDVIDTYLEDANVHIGSEFRDCHQYTVFRNGCVITDLIYYWWPVATVQIGNHSENYYALKLMYDHFNNGGIPPLDYETTHYANAETWAGEAIQRAGGGGSPTQSVPVSQIPSSLRPLYATTGHGTHVAYHMTPTLMQIAHSGRGSGGPLEIYSSKLVEIPAQLFAQPRQQTEFCGLFHPRRVPEERFSDITPMTEPAFNPAWSDMFFPQEMAVLRANPGTCLAQNLTGFGFLGGQSPSFLNSLANRLGVGSLRGRGFGRYETCITNWGRVKPVTTNTQDVPLGPALAGPLMYKAVDTQRILGRRRSVFKISPLDKVQWVRPGNILGERCAPLAAGGPPTHLVHRTHLPSSDSHPGVSAITLWKFFIGCYPDRGCLK